MRAPMMMRLPAVQTSCWQSLSQLRGCLKMLWMASEDHHGRVQILSRLWSPAALGLDILYKPLDEPTHHDMHGPQTAYLLREGADGLRFLGVPVLHWVHPRHGSGWR